MNGGTELTVLYGLIQYGRSAWNQFHDDLKAEMFGGVNRRIFERIRDRHAENLPVDQFVLSEDLPDTDQVQHIMLGYCSRPGLADYVAELGKRHAQRRELEIGYSLTAGEIGREDAIRMLADLEIREARAETMNVREAMHDWMARIEHDIENPNDGLMTGWLDADRVLGGVRGGNLMILAGRPAMGKTAAAINIALNQTEPVLFFSLEMGAEELMDRAIATFDVPHDHLRQPRHLNDGDWSKITRAMQEIDKRDLMINDTGGISIGAIEKISRKIHGQTPLALIVIDYLQLVTCRAESRLQEVSEISRRLKALAKNLGVPVLALGQLNRGVEGRANPVPNLADLRESGQLEQDADQVIFVHRPEVFDSEDRPGIAELHIKKNRHGATGVATLSWQGRFQRFLDFTPEYKQEAAA